MFENSTQQTCSTCISPSLGTHALTKYTSQFVSSFICLIFILAALIALKTSVLMVFVMIYAISAVRQNRFDTLNKLVTKHTTKQLRIIHHTIKQLHRTSKNNKSHNKITQ